MDKKPRPFTLGQKELTEMLGENGWHEGLHRVTFTNDPGWTGYVREDGTGLALENPSHLEMLALRQSMVGGTAFTVNETYLWAV